MITLAITLDQDKDSSIVPTSIDEHEVIEDYEDISIKLTGNVGNDDEYIEFEINTWNNIDNVVARREDIADQVVLDKINNDEAFSTYDNSSSIELFASNASTRFNSLSTNPAFTNPSTGNFRALDTAGILFEIGNYGTTTSTNMTVFIYLDNVYLGYAHLGNLLPDYYFSCRLEISGVREGSHNIRLNLDNGLLINRNFYWETSGLPNLISTISNVPASYGVKSNEDIGYEFKVYNRGTASISQNILCHIYVDNSLLASASIAGGLSAGDSASGSFNLNFNDNLVVFVSSDLTDVYSTSNFERATEWNDITEHVAISGVNYGAIPNNETIRVFMNDLGPGERGVIYAGLRNDGKMYYIYIDIASNTYMFPDLKKDLERTYIHELAHAIGLSHPYAFGYDDLLSMMQNSFDGGYANPAASHTITFDDEFNLIDKHSHKVR